jgi:hypothetical protein
MTRDDLWTSFIGLIEAYSQLLNEPDIDSFVVGMLPNSTGRTHDPAFAISYHQLFPDEGIRDMRQACVGLADFVDAEMRGWWKISAAKRISDDLRAASIDPERSPEPVRSWIRALGH